jgi:hypothetical protein
MALTDDELVNYPLRRITTQPSYYDALEPHDRYTWVRAELATGKYESAENIGLSSVLFLGMNASPWNADYAMFRLLLSEFDPALAAKRVTDSRSARFFIEAYGLERSLPFIDDEIWFTAFSEEVFGKEEKATKLEIKTLLQHRGAERIAELIFNEKAGAVYVDIFGIEATANLPLRLAKQLKGKHLEESLGL